MQLNFIEQLVTEKSDHDSRHEDQSIQANSLNRWLRKFQKRCHNLIARCFLDFP